MSDVLTCPFFGGEDILMKFARGDPGGPPVSGFLECDDCGATGPHYEEPGGGRINEAMARAEALGGWNCRPEHRVIEKIEL